MLEGKGTQGGTVRPHDVSAPLGYLCSWVYSVFCHSGGSPVAGILQTHPLLAGMWVPSLPGTSAHYRFGIKRQGATLALPALVPGPPQETQQHPAWSPQAKRLHSCWPQLNQCLGLLASRQLLHFSKMAKKSKLFALLKHTLNRFSIHFWLAISYSRSFH